MTIHAYILQYPVDDYTQSIDFYELKELKKYVAKNKIKDYTIKHYTIDNAPQSEREAMINARKTSRV